VYQIRNVNDIVLVPTPKKIVASGAGAGAVAAIDQLLR